jgi:uncharacterized membrane protein (UPF0136 family)
MQYESSNMLSFVKIYFLIFGLLTIVGGAMGYIKAHSAASLIAGGVSGALLITSALLLPGYLRAGLAMGLIVSLALAGRFIPALLHGKMNPAVYVAPLAVIGVVLGAVLLFGARSGD